MIYPINTALTYTAIGSTIGLPDDTLSYVWVFDDTATANGASTPKAWATPVGFTCQYLYTQIQASGGPGGNVLEIGGLVG